MEHSFKHFPTSQSQNREEPTVPTVTMHQFANICSIGTFLQTYRDINRWKAFSIEVLNSIGRTWSNNRYMGPINCSKSVWNSSVNEEIFLVLSNRIRRVRVENELVLSFHHGSKEFVYTSCHTRFGSLDMSILCCTQHRTTCKQNCNNITIRLCL